MAPGRPWPDPGPTLVAPGRADPGPRASWLGPTLEGQGQGPVKVGWPWPGPAHGQCGLFTPHTVNQPCPIFKERYFLGKVTIGSTALDETVDIPEEYK